MQTNTRAAEDVSYIKQKMDELKRQKELAMGINQPPPSAETLEQEVVEQQELGDWACG